MKRVYLTALCVATLLMAFACAAANSRGGKTAAAAPATAANVSPAPQETAAPILASAAPEASQAPATQPAPAVEAPPLPPPLPASPTLPKGHPDIAQMMQQQAQQQQQPGQLPKGHPDISQMRKPTAVPTPGATSRPAIIGTLTVRAVQSTKDAPAIAPGTPITVELYQNDQVLDKREAKLDASGVATFDSIPVGLNVQPLARVNYKGVDYEALGNVMDAAHADQQVQLPVYESTDQQPAWQIRMQHIILQPTSEGVQVMEMLAVENPSDRAWIGKQPAAAAGAAAVAGAGAAGAGSDKRVTTVFPLPAGASNVQLAGGFSESAVKIETDHVVNSAALLPGISQFRLVYTVPVNDGKAELALTAPAAIAHAMVFVPDDGSSVRAEGLESGEVADMGNGKTRFYKAQDVAAGAVMKLSLSGITASAAAASEPAGGATSGSIAPSGGMASAGASGQIARVVAAAGGLAIFVVGGMLLLIKSPKRAAKA